MSAEYTTVEINRTPVIDPGDTIEIDLYWSGDGVPEKNRLFLAYNPKLISEDDPGRILTYVSKAEYPDGTISPASGEEYMATHEVDFPSTHVGLVETVFHPDPDIEYPDRVISPRVSERGHDSHAPVEIRLNAGRCPAGDYTIPLIFTYSSDDELKQDRLDIEIHVRSWVERHRRKLELGGVLSVIGTIILVGIAFL